METETSCESLRKELDNLRRKMAELEDESRLKEKQYQMALDESRHGEKRLDELRRQLESSLEGANADLGDLRLKVSAAEGRVKALECQLARVEETKQDVEFKLGSIVSSLRRSIGFSQSMPRSGSPLRARSPSPRRIRPHAPTKGKSGECLI